MGRGAGGYTAKAILRCTESSNSAPFWHFCDHHSRYRSQGHALTRAPDPLATDQVSTAPSWGSVTLLLQLSELRGIFGPLDYQFIIKGCNGNILIEEMQKAK